MKFPPRSNPPATISSMMNPPTYFHCLSRTPSRLTIFGMILNITSCQINKPKSSERTLLIMTKYVTKTCPYKNQENEIQTTHLKTKQKTYQKTSAKPSWRLYSNTKKSQKTYWTNCKQDPIKILWTFLNKTKNKSPP